MKTMDKRLRLVINFLEEVNYETLDRKYQKKYGDIFFSDTCLNYKILKHSHDISLYYFFVKNTHGGFVVKVFCGEKQRNPFFREEWKTEAAANEGLAPNVVTSFAVCGRSGVGKFNDFILLSSFETFYGILVLDYCKISFTDFVKSPQYKGGGFNQLELLENSVVRLIDRIAEKKIFFWI